MIVSAPRLASVGRRPFVARVLSWLWNGVQVLHSTTLPVLVLVMVVVRTRALLLVHCWYMRSSVANVQWRVYFPCACGSELARLSPFVN